MKKEMKIKGPRKITLSRETLRNLDAEDMKHAIGLTTDACNTVRTSICRSNCTTC